MYEMSQRHPVWVAEIHVTACNSVRNLYMLPSYQNQHLSYHSKKIAESELTDFVCRKAN
jgi:hypothetical protein